METKKPDLWQKANGKLVKVREQLESENEFWAVAPESAAS